MIKVGTLVRLLPGAIEHNGADPHSPVEGHCYFVEERENGTVRLNGLGTWVSEGDVGAPVWVRYRFTTDAKDYRQGLGGAVGSATSTLRSSHTSPTPSRSPTGGQRLKMLALRISMWIPSLPCIV